MNGNITPRWMRVVGVVAAGAALTFGLLFDSRAETNAFQQPGLLTNLLATLVPLGLVLLLIDPIRSRYVRAMNQRSSRAKFAAVSHLLTTEATAAAAKLSPRLSVAARGGRQPETTLSDVAAALRSKSATADALDDEGAKRLVALAVAAARATLDAGQVLMLGDGRAVSAIEVEYASLIVGTEGIDLGLQSRCLADCCDFVARLLEAIQHQTGFRFLLTND